jgi:drug/metabolite transporter (DMT)-like permease
MIWLVSSILLTTTFFVIFKLYHLFKINTFQAIVFNYSTCVVVGSLFAFGVDYRVILVNSAWYPFGLTLGCLFISTFYLMALTAQQVSITSSTVASKISMVWPIGLGLLLFTDMKRNFGFFNLLGFLLALIALVLLNAKTSKLGATLTPKQLLLVLAVFVGTGVVDSLINLSQIYFGSPDFNKVFPVFCFLVAASGGLILTFLVRKEQFALKNLIGGIALGIPNYFSIYALMQSLSYYKGSAVFVYPIVHIGSILLSALAAFLFFKEKLGKLNYIGVVLAIVAVFLLTF